MVHGFGLLKRALDVRNIYLDVIQPLQHLEQPQLADVVLLHLHVLREMHDTPHGLDAHQWGALHYLERQGRRPLIVGRQDVEAASVHLGVLRYAPPLTSSGRVWGTMSYMLPTQT